MKSASPVLLLVEGEVVARHLLAEYLRACGFVVFEASNGDEAMRAFEMPDLLIQPNPWIQIVLADMTTPGSGFALRQWILANHAGVDVILAGSMEKTAHDAGRICNEGPALAKPYEHHLVLDHIRQALARRGTNR